MKNDSLGDRMKRYEAATRYILPPRSYTIIRVDGKAFHSFTRSMAKPYDKKLMSVMQATMLDMFSRIDGRLIAYTQSDEISIVLQDFKSHGTVPWLGGIVQKQASVAASLATAFFNENAFRLTLGNQSSALFDARVYTIPNIYEVINYLIWRQKDAMSNAISMAAHHEFSNKDLHGLNINQRQEKLFQERGINFNDYPNAFKRGSTALKDEDGISVFRDIPIFASEEGRIWLYSILNVETE